MDKVWLNSYQEGVPHEIDLHQFKSISSILEKSSNLYPNRIAFENLGTGISYKKLDKESKNFAAYLQQLGLPKGTRVALMLPNLLQYPIALFGILRAGYVVVNTNPLYTKDELVHQMNDAGVEVLVVVANFAKTVEKALPHLKTIKQIIITEIGDLFPFIKRIIVNTALKYIKKLIPEYSLPQAKRFNQVLKIGKNYQFIPVPLSHTDMAFLQYTGGTTGIAKGAILSHGNMVANVLQALAWVSPLKMNENEIIITALPLYHIFSLTANCLTFLSVGAKNILITNPRDIPQFIKQIKDTGFTIITGVNTLFNALLNNPKFKEINFTKIKCALAGGMSLQESVALKWRDQTKHSLLEAYGLTETSPAATINPMNLKEYNGSVGLPLPSTTISIRNDEGIELPFNETGELCIQGPQVMCGYWQRPDENALAFTADGYLKTGDLAQVDEKGFVYLVDRKKDLIVVSGFNVYPNEVEHVISMIPGVHEVGVIAVRDEESGERVKACVVKSDPNLTAEQLINSCREHLTAYKVPKIVEFYEELPKTNVGKILRRALK